MDKDSTSDEVEDKREDERSGMQILCNSCHHENKQTQAIKFCKTCDDELPLCEECAQSHARRNAMKGLKEMHTFIDLEQLHNFRMLRALNQGESEKHKRQPFCDLCLREQKWTKALVFCKNCKPTRLMCEDCGQHHKSQKENNHDMCDDLGEFWTFQKTSNQEDINKSPIHQSINVTRGSGLQYDGQRSTAHQSSSRLEYNQKKTNDKVPGKPHALNIKSDSISLMWERAPEQHESFQIRYKPENEDSRWKFYENYVEENNVVINGLMADTGYRFQVRGIYKDQEEPYGPISDVIKTRKSLATKMLEFCGPSIAKTVPPNYILPVQENKMSRNTDARTRQLTLGNPVKDFYDEKTILLVGATGSGKRTLVDGIANYIMGVSFKDPFRFKMVPLEENEMKNNNQAHSQTEWITMYKIFPKDGSRLDYTLKIIDTPGFGDTRGIKRDKGIVDQIRHLFSEQGDRGVSFLDAVCFIVKAPDARLTVAQKYIFKAIMSLFGKDIASNICTLITFADGGNPPVHDSLEESELPFGKTFHFNNSALFAENNGTNPLSPMFWEMGSKSFIRFFEHISHLDTKNLCQTKNVLDEREQLKTIILGFRPKVTEGLSKLAELEEQLKTYQLNINKIKENQNFEYTVEETKQYLEELPVGKYVLNCLQCNLTCQEDCQIADDDRKMYCSAMDPKTKTCTVCPDRCIWSMHKSTKYIFRYFTEPVTKTYAEMKKRHEEAIGKNQMLENYIEVLTNEFDEFWNTISKMMKEMNRCRERLNEIALIPDPMSAVETIDLMIETEKMEKQSGYSKRIEMLEEMKKRACVTDDIEMLRKAIENSKISTKEVTGKSFKKKMDKNKNIFSRLFWRKQEEDD